MSPNQPKTIAKLLTDAVEQAIGHFENGTSMSDAVYKVASDFRLNPDQITRTCHILNRARMNDVRLGDDVLKSKLANVEIVDPREIIQRCYGVRPGETKMASAPAFPVATNLLKTASASTTLVKHAAASPLRSPSAQPRAPKTAGLYHGLGVAEVVRLESQLTQKMASIETALTQQAQKLKLACKVAEDLFKRMSIDTQAEVADQARYYFEERDPERLVTLNSLMDTVMPVEAQVKLAIQPAVPELWNTAMFGNRGFVPAVELLDKLARTFAASVKEASAEWGDAKARLEHLRAVTTDDGTVNEKIAIGQSALEFDESNIKIAAEKHAVGMVGSFVGSMVGAGAGAGVPSRAVGSGVGPTDVDKYTLQIRQPQHEAALAAIRARSNLQDLVNNDPIISGYDPHAVLSAFNDLSQYSPRATESNAVLRSAMRQMLQNHASIFDLQQVRNTERAGAMR